MGADTSLYSRLAGVNIHWPERFDAVHTPTILRAIRAASNDEIEPNPLVFAATSWSADKVVMPTRYWAIMAASLAKTPLATAQLWVGLEAVTVYAPLRKFVRR